MAAQPETTRAAVPALSDTPPAARQHPWSGYVAYRLSAWARTAGERVVQARVATFGLEWVLPSTLAVLAIERYERLELLLVPFLLERALRRPVRALAPASSLAGRIGRYIREHGVEEVGNADHGDLGPFGSDGVGSVFVVFGPQPETGAESGRDSKPVSAVSPLVRRRRFRDAALLGVSAAFLRDTAQPAAEPQRFVTVRFAALDCSYSPIRSSSPTLVRLARAYLSELPRRAARELPLDDSVLGAGAAIALSAGSPIELVPMLHEKPYRGLAGCSPHDLPALWRDPYSSLQRAADAVARKAASDAGSVAPVGFEHVIAGLRYWGYRHIRDADWLRRRACLALQRIRSSGRQRLEPDTAASLEAASVDEPLPDLEHAITTVLALDRKALAQSAAMRGLRHMDPAAGIVRRIALLPRAPVLRGLREWHRQADQDLFEHDYARFYDPALSKGPDVGRPFLLTPLWIRAGIVLAHGYMAAPLEVRALAEFLFSRGYAVYGVRLRGHGTAPADLAQTPWSEWYAGINRGYAVLRGLTNRIVLGGFSTGGCLALIGGARKQAPLAGVFSICAPWQIQSYGLRLAPSVVTLNTLLRRMGGQRAQWQFLENVPENKHINYTQNPIAGLGQLVEVIDAMDAILPEVRVPTLIAQASHDDTVAPNSANRIFERLGSTQKRMVVFERYRHGIVNGDGREEVFSVVQHWLDSLEASASNASTPRT